MALDLSTLSATTKPHAFTYDWKTAATYALGIGAKRDELSLVYEGAKGGLKLVPTFAVLPAYPAVMELLGKTGADFAMVVHGAQTVRAHRPAPPEGTVETTGRLKAIYDLKKFAQIVIETETLQSGEPLFETTWSIIVRGAGGFEGPRPPPGTEPAPPKDRAPDFRVVEATSAEQALLYRLSGDTNPLHADPAFAQSVGFAQGPILHGLATFGFAARAIINSCAGGEPERLRAIGGQFRKPVWPGESLATEIWRVEPNRYAVAVSVPERNETVLAAGWAEIG